MTVQKHVEASVSTAAYLSLSSAFGWVQGQDMVISFPGFTMEKVDEGDTSWAIDEADEPEENYTHEGIIAEIREVVDFANEADAQMIVWT